MESSRSERKKSFRGRYEAHTHRRMIFALFVHISNQNVIKRHLFIAQHSSMGDMEWGIRIFLGTVLMALCMNPFARMKNIHNGININENWFRHSKLIKGINNRIGFPGIFYLWKLISDWVWFLFHFWWNNFKVNLVKIFLIFKVWKSFQPLIKN